MNSGANDPNDIIYKLRRADKIVKKERKQRLQEKLKAIEEDANSLFTEKSSQEMIDACNQLIEHIKVHHTTENIHSLMKKIENVDSILLDGTSREGFDCCIMNLEKLQNCKTPISDIKESLEKLVMDTKFKAMKIINECKRLEKKKNRNLWSRVYYHRGRRKMKKINMNFERYSID